jgi:UDP-glucose 4-epimerase
VNISTGREISINETFSILKKITGISIPAKHGPALPGEQLRSVLSFEKAKQNISWSPTTSFEEGLKETVVFFKSLKN